MGKVRIVNWIVTRKCNLKCSYCRIASSYNQPKEYPPYDYYLKNEMSLDFILESLKRLKLHNPDCFMIFYGGEPTLRDDLSEIIQYCHDNKIFYTVITNNSEQVQKRIANLFDKVGYLEGLTSSVDPIIFDKETTGDIVKKSLAGLERLYQYRDKVKDLVAEITVDKYNIKYLYPLVQELTKRGISSSITFLDIAKSQHYDFSNVTDESMLVSKEEALPILNVLDDDDEVNIHMKTLLLPKIYQSLPSDLDCEIEKGVHNLTIDSNGTVRLCLRIRGSKTPSFRLVDYLDECGKLNSNLKENLEEDKKKYCKLCNWTCMCMSKLTNENPNLFNDLTHSERRK